MRKLRAIFFLPLLSLTMVFGQDSQEQPQLEIESLQGEAEIDLNTGLATATNGVIVKYGDAVLTADNATVNYTNREVYAEGHVRIRRGDQTWVGERIRYNLNTDQINAEDFRTGQPPLFAAGRGLLGDQTNQIYIATNALVTTDDVAQPAQTIRAKRIKIVPDKYVEARHAFYYVGSVPVLYFPYYRRALGPHANHFNFIPGYKSDFGPFLLGSYTWFLSEQLDGELHADYRQKRGFGFGPDVNYHLGRFGEGTISYYYMNDQDPPKAQDPGNDPFNPKRVDSDRQRVAFSHQATLRSNLTVKAVADYQSDYRVEKDFFESEYRVNPQPKSFLEVNQLWSNFSLDVLAQPRLNDFLETVERLPDVKLTAFRQQLGETPFYYESESSIGYYDRKFSDTNTVMADYSASRVDSFHQLLLPYTFFGWLNVTPRAGGRFTYYGEAGGPGATTTEEYRGVFNTGAEFSLKASRLWRGVQSKFWDADGLRHILEPSVNYVYVPTPNVLTNQIPQFDYESPSYPLLPIDFPDYNSIDSIQSQNVLRFGLRNKLQTKREAGLDNLLNAAVYTDWNLNPRNGQGTFSDLYSDIDLKPRTWITFNSSVRFDISREVTRLTDHTLTLQPNNVWSWTFGNRYLRGGSPLGDGQDLLTSRFYYRLNENWGTRMTHYYDLRNSVLAEQTYTLYRDLRSWTTALALRLRNNDPGPYDVTVALTFSLKAFPRFGVGDDKDKTSLLLGG